MTKTIPDHTDQIQVLADFDFTTLDEAARQVKPDILIGNSNGAKISRPLDIPLVRVGLPIHDRLGAARLMHVGYRRTQQLFDGIVNAFIKRKQEHSPVRYTHM